MKRHIFVIVAVFAFLLVYGCARKGQDVLARINDEVITLDEFNEKIVSLPQHYQEIVKGQKGKFLDELIKEELLHKEALKSGIGDDAEVKEIFVEAKKKILVSRLLKIRVEDKISVSEEDLKRYYDEHSEEFMLPERWRASHILLDTLEEAEEIKERLEQGASFEELAEKRSKDATSRQKGDVGYFSKGQLIPEFENACFELEVGELSGVVKTQFGYHIIKLTDRKSPAVQEFLDVKELIKKELEREQKKQLFDELMQNLRDNAKITINEKFLKEEETQEEKIDTNE